MVEASKPVTPKLRAVLAELRPFAREAVPTVRDLSRARALRRARTTTSSTSRRASRRCATSPCARSSATARSARAASTRRSSRSKGQTPHFAYFRPYVVDFTGWVDDFSHSGIYDANGSASRVATSVNAFAAVGAQLKLMPEELRQELVERASRGPARTTAARAAASAPPPTARNPWKPTEDFNCDPTQIPPGK